MRFSGTGSRNSETLSNQQLQTWPESGHKAQHWGLAGCGSKSSQLPITASLEYIQHKAIVLPNFSYKMLLNLG